MLNLFIFVSSFGFGHLTRTIALVRDIMEKSEKVSIHFIGPNEHCDFFMQSLKTSNKEIINRVKIKKFQTDLGLHYNKYSLEPDINKSLTNAFEFYVKQKGKKVEELKKIVGNYSNSIIYSDISPLAFDLAEELNLFSIAASNFDWYSVFANLDVKDSESEEIQQKISKSLYESYRKSDVLIRFPLSDLESFIPLGRKKILDVGFFARKKTITKDEFQRRFKIPRNYSTAYISYGMNISLDLEKLDSLLKQNPSLPVHFFTSNINDSKSDIPSIPSDETESQNWIGNSDFFIGKPGWGSLSECIINEVKMLLIPIKSNVESQILLQNTLKLGGTKILSQEEFQEMDWVNELDNIMIPEYKDNIDKSGANTITNYILDLI
jgi:hypothetical protein